MPALYDAYQIELEHLLMADTLFAFLVTAAITIAMWRRKPSVTRMAVAGLLLGLAAVTRSIGLPLLVILVVYLLIRRVGVRVVAAGVIACAVPVGSYVLWFHAWYQQYAMTQTHRDLPVLPRDGIRGLRQAQPAARRESPVHVGAAKTTA